MRADKIYIYIRMSKCSVRIGSIHSSVDGSFDSH